MLSKAQNKYIRSLSHQKYREEHGVFVVEGDKIALEWLRSSAKIHMIVALPGWIDQHQRVITKHPEAVLIEAEEHHLQAVSNLQTPNNVLLVVHLSETEKLPVLNDWCLALDDIHDPGNMGTMLRIADWFGIKYVLASEGSVDFYNPKVVQSAMGAHLRVAFHTVDLQQVLSESKMPVYAAVLNGESIYSVNTPAKGVILIGNESKGISGGLQKIATHKLTIPRIGGAESLNAAVSTGIICALLIKP